MYYCTGCFCWKKHLQSRLLNNLISIPTTDRQEKKIPFEVKQIFYRHPKISINKHSYLVTMHASYSKTQHQSPIQYKADVSLEEQENQKDLNK